MNTNQQQQIDFGSDPKEFERVMRACNHPWVKDWDNPVDEPMTCELCQSKVSPDDYQGHMESHRPQQTRGRYGIKEGDLVIHKDEHSHESEGIAWSDAMMSSNRIKVNFTNGFRRGQCRWVPLDQVSHAAIGCTNDGQHEVRKAECAETQRIIEAKQTGEGTAPRRYVVTVNRQSQSRQFGVYLNGNLVEGGFFNKSAAIAAAQVLRENSLKA